MESVVLEPLANVAEEDLTAKWLRQRFAAPPAYEPATIGDGWMNPRPGGFRSAAVLVPVIDRDETLTVLFTRRTAHLHDHAGQISFPGGRTEPGEDAVQTALRETEEEIGLARDRVHVLGELNQYTTVTGYRVTPVVGVVQPPFDLAPDDFEVAEVFEVPLAFLLDPANHRRESRVFNGVERRFYAMPYGDKYIWGATAAMLMNLYDLLRD
jgi:8-oxo-dGTP pyrophosphatase MutT (NUDIX family)